MDANVQIAEILDVVHAIFRLHGLQPQMPFRTTEDAKMAEDILAKGKVARATAIYVRLFTSPSLHFDLLLPHRIHCFHSYPFSASGLYANYAQSSEGTT